MHFAMPTHATSSSSTNVLRCLVLLTIFGYCAPQAYYYPNYPYRRSGYAYNAPAAQQQQQQPQRRPQPTTATNRLTNGYDYQPNANYNSKYQPIAIDDSYSSKRYKDEERGKFRVSKADAENAKFAGVSNQEAAEESGKTFKHKRRKFQQRQRPFLNPCLGLGRDASNTTPAPQEQGRFLWDLNVYNVYPSTPVVQQSPLSFGGGCGGYGGYGGGYGGGLGGLAGLASGLGLGGGGLGGGGLLSDPIADAYPVAQPPLNNFLSLFAPGILQNALAVTARPQLQQYQADTDASEVNDLQSDPEVDPAYRPPPVQQPVRRRPPPNRVYYDSAGAAPVTPAQLVGGVATTVNGIIQQLTGNVQPVYQQSYRSQQQYYRSQQPYRRSAAYG